MTAPHDATPPRFDGQLAASDEIVYELTLFVSGASYLAGRAIANARRLCDVHLDGRYHLAVVDVHDDPNAVRRNRVIATPTLVKVRPLPVRQVVGDLSNISKVCATLGLPVPNDAPPTLS